MVAPGRAKAAGLSGVSTVVLRSGPCRAMVGLGGAWSADRGVQVGPGRFPGPSLGQVQGQAARGAGEPGGNVDQVGADGGGGGAGVERAGQGPGGAGEVVRDRPQQRPRRVRGERS